MSIFGRRTRTHMIYALNLNGRRSRALLLSVLLCGSLMAGVLLVERCIAPVAVSVAQNTGRQKVVAAINQSTLSVLARDKVEYAKLCTVEKDASGNIASISTNAVLLNEIKASIALAVQDRITNGDTLDVGIPIGSLLPGYLVKGYGPKIRVRLIALNGLDVQVNNRFEAAGINQTHHVIELQISCPVKVIVPNGERQIDVATTVQLTDAIIVGQVPVVYLQK